uniref:RCC1 domain containing 1 n=1 Tax=Eptatretus burgeri TaxID=7764 RepID=A0A8C4NI62_EPTBU
HELSLSEGVQVRRLALGREHAILLSFTGQVLTWGSGRHGQLGHGGLEMENKARLVEALHGLPILQVAAGGWHSLALSCKSLLPAVPVRRLAPEPVRVACETCDALLRDLEPRGFISIQALPALLDFPHGEDIATIACGSRHSVAITKCGKLYTWGWGAYGQLGLGDRRSHDEPHFVSFLQEQGLRPCAVTCGSWATFVHVDNSKTSASDMVSPMQDGCL